MAAWMRPAAQRERSKRRAACKRPLSAPQEVGPKGMQKSLEGAVMRCPICGHRLYWVFTDKGVVRVCRACGEIRGRRYG